jgi:hypothetical protein
MPSLPPKQPQRPTLPAPLDALEKRAARFAESAEFTEAFTAATKNAKTWEKAVADPRAFFERREVKIPRGLEVRLGVPEMRMPAPGMETFRIVMTRCRTYWVKKRNAPGYEQVTICFGFEIVPIPFPLPGPIPPIAGGGSGPRSTRG